MLRFLVELHSYVYSYDRHRPKSSTVRSMFSDPRDFVRMFQCSFSFVRRLLQLWSHLFANFIYVCRRRLLQTSAVLEQLPHRNCITSTCFPFTSLPIASSVLLFLFALPFKWDIAGSPRTMLCDRYRLLGRYVITPRCCRMSTFDSLIKHPPASFCRGEGGASACLKASQSRQSSLFVCLRLLVHISTCVSRQRWTDSAIMVVRTCLIPRVMIGKTDMPIL